MARLRKQTIGGISNFGDYYIHLLGQADKDALAELLGNRVVVLLNSAVWDNDRFGPFESSKPAKALMDLINARANHIKSCASRHKTPMPVVQWAKEKKDLKVVVPK